MTQRGFTLIEMVVAITLLSLVMLATVTALRTLANTQRALSERAERNDELRAVSGFLRDSLESTVIGRNLGGLSLGATPGVRTVFELRGDALMWRSVMRFGESRGGAQLLRVAKEESRLVLRWAGEEAMRADYDWNSAAARTLVEDLQEFAVSYRREPGDGWAEEWDRRGAPGWVRLRIRSHQRYWPDLVVRVAR